MAKQAFGILAAAPGVGAATVVVTRVAGSGTRGIGSRR